MTTSGKELNILCITSKKQANNKLVKLLSKRATSLLIICIITCLKRAEHNNIKIADKNRKNPAVCAIIIETNIVIPFKKYI